MRRENLPDWAHDKVTWKWTVRSNNVTSRRGGDVAQQRYQVLHLGLTGDVIGTS